ncbi:MAG TPA: bifunctional phosphoglucose/phosphomannose isomerase [Mycobacteriales bacterium]|nr:bifunctional phosphoglucose/phosphomannose isomerase [Mycobacteriales bacterium]
MTVPLDLDDAAALSAADPEGMLLAVASGAAQVREAVVLSAEAGLSRLADEGRPRAVVVCGMGGSGIAGDVLAAVAGAGCPVPVLTHRGPGLPAWVGAADLVVAVSCSGSTQETLSALEEAVRRGCRLLVVGAAGSPVEELAGRGRGAFVPVAQGRQPRASLWSLSVPLLCAGNALGLLSADAEALAEAATVLEAVATRCRPDADTVLNPGKSLATELQGALPVIWGASPLTGAAAYRFACQLNENAAAPATWGVLPEAGHNQVVAFDGPWARGARSEQDLFADRLDEPERPVLRLVLLREGGEHPMVSRRADVCADLAGERGVGVSALLAEGSSPVARLASLICVTDFASTYLALAEGTDPTPVAAITALKQRTSR